MLHFFLYLIVGLLFFIQIACIFNVINHTYIENFKISTLISYDPLQHDLPIEYFNQMLQDNFMKATNTYLTKYCGCCSNWMSKYSSLEEQKIKSSFDKKFLNHSNYYDLSSNIVLDTLNIDHLLNNGNDIDINHVHSNVFINTDMFENHLADISNIAKQKKDCEDIHCLNLENKPALNVFDMKKKTVYNAK